MALQIVVEEANVATTRTGQHLKQGSDFSNTVPSAQSVAISARAVTGRGVSSGNDLHGSIQMELIDASGASVYKKTFGNLTQDSIIDFLIEINANVAQEGLLSEGPLSGQTDSQSWKAVYEVNTTSFGESGGSQKPKIRLTYSGFYQSVNPDGPLGILYSGGGNNINMQPKGGGKTTVEVDFDLQDI